MYLWVASQEHFDQLHTISYDVPLNRPCSVLQPLEDKNSYSQVLFDGLTVKTILHWIQQSKKKKIVCLGCPRIHEHLYKDSEVNDEFFY